MELAYQWSATTTKHTVKKCAQGRLHTMVHYFWEVHFSVVSAF
jgi:hypothetical protein